ncbi:Transposase, ISXO2-like domain-containing protein [Gigaspora margarita]|uniref:Transposase, ISXO2-like domain-containing protein n=1 Tax=Gigaspora margarita TaxID=4874 RepID=A0A8H4A9U1_GIGMA|nr:Transposase, ISXO2-like domain-containing protein [Gigaspora margarita]
MIGNGGIDLTGCYNEIFFAIQVKFRTDHHFKQAKDIKKFDKALELQTKEVVGFFITTIEFSEETKKAVLESKRKIFLCNEKNIISSIKKLSKFEIIKSETIFNDKVIINYEEINNKNTPIQSYLNELIRIKEILQNSKEKVFINTKNKNIYLMIKENRIDKWEKIIGIVNIKYNDILLIGYFWLCKLSYTSINVMSTFSSVTIIKFTNIFRDLAISKLTSEDYIIGGKNIICEIDESKFKKYENFWVVVLKEPKKKKCFFVITEDRKAPTLRRIIKQYVRPKSIVHTDH